MGWLLLGGWGFLQKAGVIKLTWPMTDSGLKLLGIPYLVGKVKFKLLFQGPLAK